MLPELRTLTLLLLRLSRRLPWLLTARPFTTKLVVAGLVDVF
jgi:hypothetical protein